MTKPNGFHTKLKPISMGKWHWSAHST